MAAEYDDGVLRIVRIQHPPGLALAGEIDESTYSALVSALDACGDIPGDLHLYLGHVEFCDVAGLRAMVRAIEHRRNGSRVVLHDVPPSLRTVLRIVGWDDVSDLSIEGS